MATPLALLLWLAGLAMLIIALSRISMWMERWKIEREKEEEPYRQPNDQDPSQGTKATDFSTISARLYAIAHQLHTQKEQYRRSDRDNASRSIITIVFIALTAAFACGSDWIFYRQLSEMQTERRAWVGPVDANLPTDLLESGPVKIDVMYSNTGHEPGTNFAVVAFPKVFSQIEWNNGTAKEFIIAYRSLCFNIPSPANTRMVFPSTTSSSYVAHIDSSSTDFPEILRFKASKTLVSGDDYLALVGCFVYHSIGIDHHTSFCYSYKAKETDRMHLNICTVGTDAD
jgi:hypothetical protein